MIKRSLVSLMILLAGANIGAAQDTTRVPTGVELSGHYNVSKRPLVAVRPAAGTAATLAVGQQVAAILQRDLQYSDRFEMGAVPASLASGPIDYRAWNSLNVYYLVAPTLAPTAQGYQMRVELHDVVYGNLKTTTNYDLPAATAPGFRMAVHRASDDIVKALTGQPGIAATRIVFTREINKTSYELVIVDSDGENTQRIMTAGAMIYSPTFSPDSRKLAYGVRTQTGKVELHERDVATGRVRVISARPEFSYAPSYSPDGKKLAFTVTVGSIAQEIDEYDLERSCCLRRLSRGPRDDLSPSYSADGSRIAFNSSRLGQPHIYVMSANGGEATLISPYNYGEPGYYTAPDWSPTSDDIVYAGRSRGEHQIMIGNPRNPGRANQITSSGRNEDPSWAPDGRHIVYAGVGSGGSGLYVIDSQTGNTRKLTAGKLRMPDWSSAITN
jgi:TolB protein